MGCFPSKDEPIEKAKKSEPPKSRIENVDKVQLDIKKQIRTIKDQKLQVETRTKELTAEALKQKASGNKSKAVFALKMKKLIEGRNDKLDGVLLTLEQTLQNLQEAIINKQVHDVLKQGNAAIKELQQSATIEDFQKIADDLSEQQQINDELAQIMGVDTVDDHMFEDELDQLERKEADAVACKLKPVPTDSLPEVKNKQAEKKQTEKRQAVLA
eukprot:TRINITY_DN6181_c0_g1_i5.p1 TRINITY_DN6181_c0_g1~~TRINITY_DN6181_c0_g1_i5.p1  ORF type:complete len:247 (-),score=93.73 TRINITY_DN6181_c0_g1_i5:148-789(-)